MSNFQKNLKFKKKKKSKSSKSDEGGDENQKINFTRPNDNISNNCKQDDCWWILYIILTANLIIIITVIRSGQADNHW